MAKWRIVLCSRDADDPYKWVPIMRQSRRFYSPKQAVAFTGMFTLSVLPDPPMQYFTHRVGRRLPTSFTQYSLKEDP